jgi:ferric-dicitrate binding protein FerR (iron transport regulator)
MKERLKYLFQNYLDKSGTLNEREELFAYIRESKYDVELKELIEETWKTNLVIYKQDDEEASLLFQKIVRSGAMAETSIERATSIPLYKRKVFKWTAAAAIILLIVGGWWMIEGKRPGARGEREVATTHDVPAPTNTRAVITLADGSKVYLDSAGNGTIANENNVAVIRDANGGIKYLSPAGGGELSDSPNNKRPGVDYNTLFNPRGSKVISLTLSDGTKVWLNSESSLRYPASFASASVRQVEITGEAYFEVAHNAKQPFKVHLPNGSIVEDIGTSFNINAYPDEEATRTTLIEGAVKISAQSADKNLRNQREKILKPGEQSVQIRNISVIRVQNDVDLDEVLAWKNGQFSFNRTNIVSIMKQVERWYDVQVVFADNIKEMDFTGGIARTENVSQVLKMLEKTGVVHFKIEGKKITVTK